jgi:hypothetical protein
VAAGDFDGDGNQDIAVLYKLGNLPSSFDPYVSQNGTAVFVFYGAGDGTFSAPVTIGTLAHFYSMITASDLNGDGRADLILQGSDGPYNSPALGIVHAGPGRAFTSEINYTAGTRLGEIAALDVNRDGLPDLLVANDGASSVTVLLNLGNVPVVSGSLIASPEPSTVGQPFSLSATLAPPSPATLAGSVEFSIDGVDAGSAQLSGNVATFTVSKSVTIGTHTVAATWLGNSTYPPVILSTTHTVLGIPVTITLNSSLIPATVGQQVTIWESMANSAGTPASTPGPTGTTIVNDDGVTFGTGNQISPSQTASWGYGHTFATSGQHTITATYNGDALHSPATATFIETVNPLATTIILQSSPNPSTYGQPVSFTTTVTTKPEQFLRNLLASSTVIFSGLPGGPVSVPVVFSSSSSSATVTIGTATYTTNTLPVSSYTVSAAFSGNASVTPSASAPVTQVVNPATTATTLSIGPNPAYATQTVTLSAHVIGALGIPTGTVRFLDGGALLATVPLISGNATFATALFAAGTHTITALYSGDDNNLTSTSAPITESILPSDFTLSVDPASLTLVTGHHTTLTLTATSIGAFVDSVHLTIAPLPQYATATFTPVTLQLPANGKATSQIYLDTDAVIGYLSQTRSKHKPNSPWSSNLTATLSLIFLPLIYRRARRQTTFLALAIIAILLIGATGCSGKYPGSTLPGTYSLQITATGTQTPITHTITVPFTVTR